MTYAAMALGNTAIRVQLVGVAHNTSPFYSVYPLTTSGIGTILTSTGTNPTGTGFGIGFSPQLTLVAVAHITSPFITAYSVVNFTSIGSKFANPATLPTALGESARFSPDGSLLAVGFDGNPSLFVYPISTSGFGTKYSNPATTTGDTYGMRWNPAQNVIATGHVGGAFIAAYAWTNASGFGTKYSNPASLPPTHCQDIDFTSNGADVAVAHGTSPFTSAYPWNNSTGFGTKYANPGTLPAGFGFGCKFAQSFSSSTNTFLSIAHQTSPRITAYNFTTGTGYSSKFTDPVTLPNGDGFGTDFTKTANAVGVASGANPFIQVYPWSSSGFGSKFANPATLPAGTGNDIAIS